MNLQRNFPKISIITPSYNQGQYLEETIQSVLNQNYPNLDYIVIDGGSNDQSVEIIKKYEKHLSFWVSEKDTGQSDAINKGLQKATGEIINWINSDDYYEPDTLFKISEAFVSSKALVVSGKSRLFRNDKTLEHSSGTHIYPGNLAKTIGWAKIDQPATFFHFSAIQKLGLLNTKLHYLMDRDWWVKYLFNFGLNNVLQIPDILVNFRLHYTSKTISSKQEFQIESDTYFYNLANSFRLTHYKELLKKAFKLNDCLELETSYEYDSKLVEAVINYYILLRANELYAVNDKQLTKLLLKNLRTEFLAMEDLKLWQRLNFRNKYMPIFLINLLRKNL